MLIGWVLMPDHFHLLPKPKPAESTPQIFQQHRQAHRLPLLKALRENPRSAWCRGTVHDGAQYRLWQRRFYPFNVFSEKKRLEKLD